jgi:hypothetical protein
LKSDIKVPLDENVLASDFFEPVKEFTTNLAGFVGVFDIPVKNFLEGQIFAAV